MDSKEWEKAVHASGNEHVTANGHNGSYDALGQRNIYVAAAGACKWTSLEDAIRAVIAGRRWAIDNNHGE